jgi:hypothetical protein
MKILKKGGRVVEKRGEEETKSMPQVPVDWSGTEIIWDSSAVRRLFSTCCSRGALESSSYGKQRICLSYSWSAHFHQFSPIIFLFIHNHLTLRKWCYTPLQHLDPIIPLFDFHFRIYKRDLAILTEWRQQCIAWWELINAALFAYVPSTDQSRAEGNNTECRLERKDSMAECYGTNGLRKEHVLRLPFLDKVLHHICFSYGYL